MTTAVPLKGLVPKKWISQHPQCTFCPCGVHFGCSAVHNYPPLTVTHSLGSCASGVSPQGNITPVVGFIPLDKDLSRVGTAVCVPFSPKEPGKRRRCLGKPPIDVDNREERKCANVMSIYCEI